MMADTLQNNTFPKSERLCSRKEIERLFSGGSSFSVSPLKLIFIDRVALNERPCLTMFVVPKRNFRKAHDRNKLKRRMREAFRLCKSPFHTFLRENGKQLSMALLYTGRKKEEYPAVKNAVESLLKKVMEKKA